jgi:hypothetical protein
MNGEKSTVPIGKGGLTWYTDGCKTYEGTGGGMYGHGMGKRFSCSLGEYTTVFQAEVYANKVCADNIKRHYCKRNIYILSQQSNCDQST